MTMNLRLQNMKAVSSKAFHLRDGFKIAYQEWGIGSPKRVLALHGFLDNSNSFNFLGPKLKDCHVVAIDHAGHGWSSHISADATYQFGQYIVHVKNILDSLGWDSAFLIGHSMGAIMASLFSGTFPERVDKLVLIEGLVPFTTLADHTVINFRRSIENLENARTKGLFTRAPKQYSTLHSAVEARMKSATLFPGDPYISYDGALNIVQRGAVFADGSSLMNIQDTSTGPVYFTHDVRHHVPAFLRMTHEQALNFTNCIASPTLHITAEHGISYPLDETNAHRAILSKKNLLVSEHLPGSHHLHIDPPDAPRVCEVINKFLL